MAVLRMDKLVRVSIGGSRKGKSAKPAKTSKPKSVRKSPAASGAAVTPTILVDDRLGSRDLMKHAPINKCGMLCRMEFGDVLFPGNGPNGDVVVGVEVKSVMDVIASMRTGRAQSQFIGMLDTYDQSWLLTYGLYRPNPSGLGTLQTWRHGGWADYDIAGTPVLYGEVESFLASVTAVGVNVKRVADMAEAATWIGVLARWWNKKWHKHDSFRVFNTAGQDSGMIVKVDQVTDQIAGVLKGLPGLGYERAFAAAIHFNSIEDAMSASADEWAEITTVDRRTGRARRIGPSIAASVVAAIKARKKPRSARK